MGKQEKSKVSKFAKGAASAVPDAARGEEFDPGKWRVRFVDCSQTDNGFCVQLAGVGAHKKLGDRIAWLSTTGKAVFIAQKRAKALCMAVVGAESDEEYVEFDPHGSFIDAMFPYDTEEACEYLVESGKAKSEKAAAKLIADAEFVIAIGKGGEKDDGGFFRNVNGFFAAGEESGDEEDDEDDDSDEEPESERKPAKKKAAAKRKPSRDEEDDEDDSDDDDDSDEDDSDDDEPESERKPAKKKAKRK